MKESIKRSIFILLIFTVLCGLIYPMLITGIAQIFFKESANGSIINREGEKVGSRFIGQSFQKEEYFWSRPSVTNYTFSSGSNRSITDEILKKEQEEIKQHLEATSYNEKQVPMDLYTFSGSGVDPNISVEAALFQIERIAKKRGIQEEKLQELIKENIIYSGLLGTDMVNVLELNLQLDTIS